MTSMTPTASRIPLSAATESLLARDQFLHLIDGKDVPSISGKTFDTFDPSSGNVLARLSEGDAADIDAAVKAARGAFEGPWRLWTPYERQRLLHRVHDIIETNFEELAQVETMDMGAPISRTMGFKTFVLKVIAFFASQCGSVSGETLLNSLPGSVHTMSLKAPVGVIGGIIPWNGPLGSQWWILGAVLASGCTAVLKPAEDASLSVLRTVALLHEAGMPAGVINVVTGQGSVAGAALASHPGVDRIAFTGSTATGRKIIEASAINIKKLQLELGGKSPDIVFADADLEKAVPSAAMAVFANTGQVCYAGSRVFVQRPILREFCDRLAEFTKTIRIGHGLDPDAQLGPLISKKQLDSVMSYIKLGSNEGAELIYGGLRLEGPLGDGFFVSPTIFANVENNMRIAQEEIFGPVLSVIPFDTEAEAIALGNASEYGLGGAVWSRNISTALNVVRQIHTGVMWVNCYGLIDPLVGFGGTKLSGYGAKGGRAHLDTYLYTKTVYIDT
ncbi:aldehyde dehydrogenase (plasmid) [Rhizobium ruizarguesonis]|nr:aldehyde dehydrogenase family protein [Rhizobium ruizarguesonis]MBY5882431.1 aldehyde dehydrogenase [Rhizobium leguminosarum]NKL12705.1 aldehyde dehydrogenase family protein [Rhizobium leguminosarum bv. viciae]NKL41767.1 aldehyde dehydrogenase family protein [Rhizobium leguminosarum bv. viciae]NKL66978.1 aldehyde dehydrogenase family protein [Rhizobium leguminosarum bv. viciae]TBB15072.1 aldehyde dehydrogenase [Rhizobium ruizarguesonis]